MSLDPSLGNHPGLSARCSSHVGRQFTHYDDGDNVNEFTSGISAAAYTYPSQELQERCHSWTKGTRGQILAQLLSKQDHPEDDWSSKNACFQLPEAPR